MKGCPLNNFGPCLENKCGFFTSYDHMNLEGCAIHLQLLMSVQNGMQILALRGLLQESGALPASASQFVDADGECLPPPQDYIDALIARLQDLKDKLKDVEP